MLKKVKTAVTATPNRQAQEEERERLEYLQLLSLRHVVRQFVDELRFDITNYSIPQRPNGNGQQMPDKAATKSPDQ